MLGLATRGRLVAAFAAIYLLWGGTYLAIAIGLQSIPPFILMGARAGLAGLLLLAVASLLAAALSWALGSLVSQRRGAHVPAFSLSGMQMLSGGAVLLVASALAGEWD